MGRLAISTTSEELGETTEFCSAESIGIEITDFSFARNLDGNMSQLIDRNAKAVAALSPVISHGPFQEMISTSRDPAIVEVCRKRHLSSLDAANRIGAEMYVGHTNYNPLIRHPSYQNNFPRRMLDFWLPLADWAGNHNIVIILENLWEPNPDIQSEIVAKANHPHLKASFDNGHALVFSEVPAKLWIGDLGSELTHCHLHDNWGKIDEHNEIGDGKENWPELLNAIDSSAPEAVLVIECDQFNESRKSIEKLKGFLTKYHL